MASLVVAVVIGLSVGFGFFMTARQDAHRQQFIQQCDEQGGKSVTLRHRTYCIVDGEKMEF